MELATHTPFVPQGVPPVSKPFDLMATGACWRQVLGTCQPPPKTEVPSGFKHGRLLFDPHGPFGRG